MSAWSVAGTARSDRSTGRASSPPAALSVPSAASIRIVSTAYRGMPSARATIVARPARLEPGRERLEDLAHRVVGERLEGEPDERPRARPPARPALEQLGPGERDDGQRHARAPVEHVVDEVEQAGIGPVEVLEQEDDRSGRGDPLEERAPGAEQLLAGGAGAAFEPEQDEEGVLDPAALGLVRDPARDTGRDRGPRRGLVVALDQPDPAADHLAERPERDALAVGRRPAGVPVDRVHQAVDVLASARTPSGSCRRRARR